MIGFLEDYVSPNVSFFEWMSMGVFYTAIMSVLMAFLLPLLFKPEVKDLSEAVFAWPMALIVMATMVIFWWAGVLPYEFGIDITRIPGAGE